MKIIGYMFEITLVCSLSLVAAGLLSTYDHTTKNAAFVAIGLLIGARQPFTKKP